MNGLKRWLILREGEAYSYPLGPNRELFLFKEDNGTWTLWWGQWYPDWGPQPLNEKTLATGLTFQEALNRGNDYLNWWFEKRKERKANGSVKAV